MYLDKKQEYCTKIFNDAILNYIHKQFKNEQKLNTESY